MIYQNDQESCTILFDALFEYGTTPPTFLISALYHTIGQGNESMCQWLVREYQVDPFGMGDDELDAAAASPFLAAATGKIRFAILDYFLDRWDV